VEVLEDQAERLDLTFAQQYVFDGLQRTPAALRRIAGVPLRIVDGHLQQGQKSW